MYHCRMSVRTIFAFLAVAALIFGILAVYAPPTAQSFIYEVVPTDMRAEEARWRERIEKIGARAAYEEVVRASINLSPTEQHVPAHVFGGVLYESEGIDALSICDGRMLYGCFHEFLSQAIVENGLAIVPELEQRCPSSPSIDDPISCIHGLGHGLVAYFGYTKANLDQAIAECDKLTRDPWSACVQGAFMEYDLRFFAAADGAETRPIPDGNVYDPCTEYSGIHAERCVSLLPVWWRAALFSPSPSEDMFSWAGAKCSTLPENILQYRRDCFRGIGYIAVTTYAPVLSHIKILCEKASNVPSDMQECMVYANATIGAGRNTGAL